MKENTAWLIFGTVACVTLLGIFFMGHDAAKQHGINNRELVKVCIERNKTPVVGDYGRLEGCS